MVNILLLFLTIIRLACGQPGFISIRSCATSDFKDQITNITWTSDNYLVNNVGSCKTVSVPTISTFLYRKARIFGTDHRTRWCYKLPVVHGHDYLLRTTFLYGPIFRSIPGTTFNLSIGSTSISSVNSSIDSLEVEGVFAAIGNSTNICLLKDKGNAYISMLELRPLNDAIYLGGNFSVLKLIARLDIGNTNFNYRYPVDPADRHWSTQSSYSKSDILRSSNVTLHGRSSIPIEVLQSAAIGVNQLGFLHLNLDTSNDDYLIILYFLELDADVNTGQRVFDIYVNGEKKHERFDILDMGNSSNYREVPMRVRSSGHLNISLVKVSDLSIHGPICNAYEIFQVHPRSAETVESDVNAVEELRDELVGENPGNEMLQKWLGDPCVPYPWEGLTCVERDGTFVITMLNISSKNLHGPLPSSISNLRELQKLDVQNNDFTGSIPESFASLHKLSMLSIKCNPQLKGQLPPQLDTKNLSIVSGSCVEQEESSRTQAPQQTVYFIGSIAGGSVAFTVALGLIFTCFYKHTHRPNKNSDLVAKNVVLSEPSFRDLSMNRTVQPFSLQVIERATNHYRTLIGEGGFGAVYRGTLPHGQEVAVKVRSATSTQGTREFDNEVNLLSNTRHENLVPLLGYCCENDQQILIYPFMSNGSLQDRLYGEAAKRKVLDWQTRLSISLGAARGLLYLHTFAGRCIIHRDVKSSNILLDHSMCGKVADFGFSKYAPQEGDSGASLEVRGTAGYLDPEYYSTQQLSTKSDVFSFGVVLLEIVTGREPLNIHRPRNEWSLLEWAKPFIRELRIEEIVDPNIKGGYHVEAMWRVVEAALACIEPFSAYRPSMEDIVRELEDALIIENNASEYMRSIESIGGSNRIISIEPKIFLPTPTPTEASPCQIMAVLQPR